MSEKQIKTKNYKKSFFMYFLIFGFIVEVMTIGLFYVYSHYEMKQVLKDEYVSELSMKKQNIKFIIEKIQSSISAISSNEIFLSYLNNDVKNKTNVQNLFKYISQENKNYMQIRYIDINGFEKIRIDRNNYFDKSIIIDDKHLQDKSNRYYFQQSKSLKENEFWISNLDLNIENKKIQIPYQPTIRISKAIYKNEKIQGILIINVLIKDFLDKLISSWNYNVSIVDKQGYYVYSYDKNKSWSKPLDTNHNFLHENLKLKKLENIEFENYIFISNLNDVINSSQGLFFIYSIKNKIKNAMIEKDIKIGILTLILMALLSFPIAYFISSIPFKLQEKLSTTLEKLQESSSIIDKYVMTIMIDINGNIKNASKALIEKLGYKENEIKNVKFSDICEEQITDVKENIDKKETKYFLKDGRFFWAEQTLLKTNVKNQDEFTAILSDIMQKKEIEKQVLTDQLTKLNNRAGINQALENQYNLAIRYKSIFSIILLDIDFFKNINDTFGHQSGDDVLIMFSNILVKNTRANDIVGRWGGEEFIIILPQTDKKGAMFLAQNLRKIIKNHDFKIPIKVTSSFGVSSFYQGKNKNNTIKNLVKKADLALYESKEKGRDRVSFR